MWHWYAKRTIGWLCPSFSRCKEVQGQQQRDWASQKSIAIDMLHKTPFDCVWGLRQRISASNPYVRAYTLYKCPTCCRRITQHMKYLTQHMTKIYTTYDKILDKIYEFLRQHITHLTQHMKMFCTTHVNNLYNICEKYTTHDKLLNNIWYIA